MEELRNFLVNVYLKSPDIHITGVFMSLKSGKEDGSINLLLGNDIDATVPKYIISYDNIAFIERVIQGASVQQNNERLMEAQLPQPQDNQSFGAASFRTVERQRVNRDSQLADKIPVVEVLQNAEETPNSTEVTQTTETPQSLGDLPLVEDKSYAAKITKQMEDDPRSTPIHFNYGESLELLKGWKKPALSTQKNKAKKKKKTKRHINE